MIGQSSTPRSFPRLFGLATASRTALQKGARAWRQQPLLWTVNVVLLLVSTAWAGRGVYVLLFRDDPGPGDLYFRWQEQRYLYRGQNPYDIIQRSYALRSRQSPPQCSRDARTDPEIGLVYGGGYPPWYYITATVLVWPTSYQAARLFYALLNTLALGVTFAWAYGIGRWHSKAGGVFVAAAALAISGHYKAFDRGQSSILIDAFLIGVCVLMDRARPLAAGLAYGAAAMKPQTALFFAVSLLLKRQWMILVSATAYIVLASLGTWALTQTNPIEMLQQMFDIARTWVDHGNSSLLHFALLLNMDRDVATLLVTLLGLVLTGALMWLWRKSSMLTLFAIAATTGRVFTYHHPYDNVTLIFLMAALSNLVLSQRSVSAVLAFGLVGMSLWIYVQGTPRQYPLALQIGQVCSWLAGLVILLASQPHAGWLEPTKEKIATRSLIASGETA